MTLEDLMARVEHTLEDFNATQHDTWLIAEAIDCMKLIGKSLTSEIVTETVTVRDGFIPVPAYYIKFVDLLDPFAETELSWSGARRVKQLIFMPTGYPYQVVVHKYERIRVDGLGSIEYDHDIEFALISWIKWKWMEQRIMKDQVGELRKANVAYTRMLKDDAHDNVANARGMLNLAKHDRPMMAGAAHARSNTKYRR